MSRHDTQSGPALSPWTAGRIARGLGWFSIGLGLAEILAPRSFTRALGLTGAEPVVEAYGLREVVTGIGILVSRDPAPWLWGRVAGDALDIATVMSGARPHNPKKDNVGIALAALAGVAILDVLAAKALSEARRAPQRPSARPAVPALLGAYRLRSGFRRGVDAMRGAARDFEIPRDYRVPEALRPWS